MTPADFRATLARLGHTQSSFARLLAELGDARPPATILRTVQEIASRDRAAPVPWAVACLLSALERQALPAGEALLQTPGAHQNGPPTSCAKAAAQARER